MTQSRRRSLAGPIAFALGGSIAGFPLFGFFYLLYNDRFAGSDAAFEGFLLFAIVLLFAGLFVASIGAQMILEDSQK
jgi:formate-dependent nitrite reductase membrane component NrfD